ncbi:3-hydroxyacyl-CoA dehydrogenase family protein [Nonomuraea wenchangensis]|uniref:3-hydroxyacyl-CoA dehydrogenase family protein n=1 Tax=Nonomuraea wenchangensis TaxID=568860 RepID=UPI003723AEE1
MLTQGYILNSLLVPLLFAAGKLWVNGVATPETIDAAWRVASQSPFGPHSDPRRHRPHDLVSRRGRCAGPGRPGVRRRDEGATVGPVWPSHRLSAGLPPAREVERQDDDPQAQAAKGPSGGLAQLDRSRREVDGCSAPGMGRRVLVDPAHAPEQDRK